MKFEIDYKFKKRLDNILGDKDRDIGFVADKLNLTRQELFAKIQDIGGYSIAGALGINGIISKL